MRITRSMGVDGEDVQELHRVSACYLITFTMVLTSFRVNESDFDSEEP